jgi:phage-related protein
MNEQVQKQEIPVIFFRTESGEEPVRTWLKELPEDERHRVGVEIQKVQWRWPCGPPLVKPIGDNMLEIRITLPNRIARVLAFHSKDSLVLVSGFIKKTQELPQQELELARKRKNLWLKEQIDIQEVPSSHFLKKKASTKK